MDKCCAARASRDRGRRSRTRVTLLRELKKSVDGDISTPGIRSSQAMGRRRICFLCRVMHPTKGTRKTRPDVCSFRRVVR